MKYGLLISPSKFRKRLISEAKNSGISGLEDRLVTINDNFRRKRLYEDFERDPYLRRNGQLVFSINEQNSDFNLLSIFSVESIMSLVENPIIRMGDEIIGPVMGLEGKIIILPDTNIVLTRSLLRNLSNDPAIYVDNMTIILEEAKERGLSGYRVVPRELLRGENSIKSRLAGQKEDYVKEVMLLYDCVWNFFTDVINRLTDTLEKHRDWSDRKIAESASRYYYEVGLYAKQVEKLRKKNNLNIVADRLLIASSSVLNLADSRDVAVVVSTDSDLESISKLMHDEIIPMYVARRAYTALPRHRKNFQRRTVTSPTQLIPAVKDHLKVSEKGWRYSNNPFCCSGIVYNPKTNSFYFSTLPQRYVDYIHNIGRFQDSKEFRDAVFSDSGFSPNLALENLFSHTQRILPQTSASTHQFPIDLSVDNLNPKGGYSDRRT